MYGIKPTLTRQIILQYISEKDIYERYLYPVEFNKLFINPFRTDNKPTCSFYVDSRGIIIFKDHSGQFYGDCFNIVELYYKFYKEIDLSFSQLLSTIVEDFKIVFDGREFERKIYIPEKKEIRVKRQLFTNKDLDYWGERFIDEQRLKKFNVFSCDKLWINDKIVYTYKESDPGYIYHFGGYQYKIYFPFRNEYRFICNTSEIQGFQQLPDKGEFLVITKSLKDVMVYDIFGIPAIASQTEATIIDKKILDALHLRFSNIFTNFDFDRTGLRSSFKMFRQYGLPMLIFTNGKYNSINYQAKDIDEYIVKFGKEKTLELIKETYNRII